MLVVLHARFAMLISIFYLFNSASAESYHLSRNDLPFGQGADMPRGLSSSTNYFHRDDDDDADIEPDDFRLGVFRQNFTQSITSLFLSDITSPLHPFFALTLPVHYILISVRHYQSITSFFRSNITSP